MRKLFVILTLGLLALVVSCETLNVGPDSNPRRFAINSVTVTPTSVQAGGAVTVTANFTGVSGPFTFLFTFSDCVTPTTRTVTVPNGSTTASVTVNTDAFALTPASKNCTVTVTGTDNASATAGPASANFTVTAIPNTAPTLTATANDANCTVSVLVADAEGDDVTVVGTPGAGFTAGNGTQTVNGGNGTLTFNFSPVDLFNDTSDTISFAATDAQGQASAPVVATLSCTAGTLAANTLYAIPLNPTADAGAPVTIVVASGELPNAFHFLTGVRITAPAAAGMAYVPGSFNTGAPGGTNQVADGFWEPMVFDNPGAPAKFITPPDDLVGISDAGGGLQAIDLNLTPRADAGPNEIPAGASEGALFSFQLTFANPGTYHLGFQETNVVSRTYYQDTSQADEFFWGDIDNDNPGFPNTVTVQ